MLRKLLWHRSRGVAMVEMAIVAPILFFLIFGLMDVSIYVFQFQVANQSAQAAARWGVVTSHFVQINGASYPQCPAATPPAGMVAAAEQAAGPFASDLQIVDNGTGQPAPGTLVPAGLEYCQITVTIPYAGFADFFGLMPGNVTATALDYPS